MPKTTTYIIDTSALLAAGKQALYSFAGKELIIPLPVVRELEKKRNDPLVGFVARSVLRALEEINDKSEGGGLHDGVSIDNKGGTVRIEVNHVSKATIPDSIRNDPSNDSLILVIAKNLAVEKLTTNNMVLISNDLPMRIIARSVLNIGAEPFKDSSIQGNNTGMSEATTTGEKITSLFGKENKNKTLNLDDVDFSDGIPDSRNCGIILRNAENHSQSTLTVLNGKEIRPVNAGLEALGIKGKSAEQRIALHYLMDTKRGVVSLGGPAGTGKTILALAAGLDQTINGNHYSKVVVFRPLNAVGDQELGYAPGTLEEKMMPWAGAIFDAMDAIPSAGLAEKVIESGKLEVLPVTHIRGRSFTKTFIIIDEAQNLERNTLLSILARIGDGSKAIFCWDVSQRDNLHIGQQDGIVAVVDKLKTEEEFAHVTLHKSERSNVAKMAAKILEDLL